jgi:hypothetical protein
MTSNMHEELFFDLEIRERTELAYVIEQLQHLNEQILQQGYTDVTLVISPQMNAPSDEERVEVYVAAYRPATPEELAKQAEQEAKKFAKQHQDLVRQLRRMTPEEVGKLLALAGKTPT